jgi:hypothetical protein
MMAAIAELLKEIQNVFVADGTAACLKTIDNDGMDCGEPKKSYSGDKQGKNQPNFQSGPKLDRGLPLNCFSEG